MSETEGFGSEVMGDIGGVVETAAHAVGGIADGATGNWDGAADSALSMSESALGVATAGISTAAEAGFDEVSHALGGPSAHDALNEGAQAAGGALGDGMFDLVGADQSHAAAVSFDDGDILGGLGHMASGAGSTIAGAAESGAEAVGSAVASGVEAAGSAVSDAASSVVDGAESLASQAWDAL